MNLKSLFYSLTNLGRGHNNSEVDDLAFPDMSAEDKALLRRMETARLLKQHGGKSPESSTKLRGSAEDSKALATLAREIEATEKATKKLNAEIANQNAERQKLDAEIKSRNAAIAAHEAENKALEASTPANLLNVKGMKPEASKGAKLRALQIVASMPIDFYNPEAEERTFRNKRKAAPKAPSAAAPAQAEADPAEDGPETWEEFVAEYKSLSDEEAQRFYAKHGSRFGF